jgi:hypothetical protein
MIVPAFATDEQQARARRIDARQTALDADRRELRLAIAAEGHKLARPIEARAKELEQARLDPLIAAGIARPKMISRPGSEEAELRMQLKDINFAIGLLERNAGQL